MFVESDTTRPNKSSLPNKLYDEIIKSTLTADDRVNIDREINLHSQVAHPHVIRMISHFEGQTSLRIFLQLADNGCLFFYIHPRKGLPEQLALRFFYQTVCAVAHIHSMGILDRDIKPENLLLNSDFDVQLCDFGWACEACSNLKKQSVCGTYDYMAPEVAEMNGHDEQADTWSLGILLFELIHGDVIRNSSFQFEQSQRNIFECQTWQIQIQRINQSRNQGIDLEDTQS